jgi:hypothetical protein
MCYRKGSTELSPDCGEATLCLALRAGFISDAQLRRFLESIGRGLPQRSFNWRLQRLTEHGLLQRHEIPVLAA